MRLGFELAAARVESALVSAQRIVTIEAECRRSPAPPKTQLRAIGQLANSEERKTWSGLLLHLKRTDVAPLRVCSSSGSWLAALVGRQRRAIRVRTILCGNPVNGDADDGLRQKRVMARILPHQRLNSTWREPKPTH